MLYPLSYGGSVVLPHAGDARWQRLATDSVADTHPRCFSVWGRPVVRVGAALR